MSDYDLKNLNIQIKIIFTKKISIPNFDYL